jgi:hypothetical protein
MALMQIQIWRSEGVGVLTAELNFTNVEDFVDCDLPRLPGLELLR